ncbi:hypothetical protein BME99_29015 [Pseudomonas protegens]|nr:hypothetical protein BME99_29015 [Pseudomonas protegens]
MVVLARIIQAEAVHQHLEEGHRRQRLALLAIERRHVQLHFVDALAEARRALGKLAQQAVAGNSPCAEQLAAQAAHPHRHAFGHLAAGDVHHMDG